MRGRPRSVARGTGRRGIQPRRSLSSGRRRRRSRRKATSGASPPQDATESRAVTDPVHARTHLAREPGEPVVARRGWRGGPHREVQGRTPMMDDHRQSDRPVVPAKFPNNAERSAAEGMEGRGLAKGNPSQQNAPRTLGRDGALSARARVREAAERDKQVRFTALLHHVYNVEHLRGAYHALKRDAAPGIDGERWRPYGEALEDNLADWSGRLKRVADRRVVRLIQKWLNAGVREDGTRTWSDKGTPQGSSISPLLANVYLHYAFDLWVRRWRKTQAHGDMIVVRYADDFIVGFQYREEAERFLTELRERLAKFGLELHPEKTRLLEFGPFAAEHRRRADEGKPETFDFIGFMHICGKKRNGRFTVVRQTIRKRLQAKLSEVKAELRRRRHGPIPEVGAWLRAVIIGHLKYYGVPMNRPALFTFCSQVGWLWYRALRRRSQTARLTWERMRRLIQRWLPPPRITHPYPLRRLGVVT